MTTDKTIEINFYDLKNFIIYYEHIIGYICQSKDFYGDRLHYYEYELRRKMFNYFLEHGNIDLSAEQLEQLEKEVLSFTNVKQDSIEDDLYEYDDEGEEDE